MSLTCPNATLVLQALQHAAEAGHLAEALASLRSGWGSIAVVIGLQPSPDEQKPFSQLCQNHYTLLWIILGSTIVAGPSEGVEQTMLELQSTLTEAFCLCWGWVCSSYRQQALCTSYFLYRDTAPLCSGIF